MLLAACTPVSARPDFQPFPEAPRVVLLARPAQVIGFLVAAVAAESLRVRRASPEDGYLETDWFDTRSGRAVSEDGAISDLAQAVKLRFWADPYVPGESILTLEVAYRPRYDPSRAERDLEAIAPDGHAGKKLVESVLGRVKEKFGSPRSGA